MENNQLQTLWLLVGWQQLQNPTKGSSSKTKDKGAFSGYFFKHSFYQEKWGLFEKKLVLFTNKQKKPAVKSAPANFGKMKKAMQKYKYGVEEIPDKDAPTEAVEAVEAAV